MKKLPILLVLMLVLSLFGCSRASNQATTDMSTSSDKSTNTNVIVDYEPSVSESQVENYQITNEGADTNNILYQQKIIYTADLSIKTDDYNASIDTLISLIDSNEGYIESSEAYDLEYSENRSVYYRVRIPSENFNAFLEATDQLGTITSSSTSSNDVTADYIDTQARITALTQQENRLLALYDKAETIDEILTIESQLSNVRYEIESYVSVIDSYDRLTSYCTIDIEIYESSIVSPVDESFGATVGRAFQESFLSVVAFFQDIIIFVIYAFPYLVIVAIIAMIVIAVKKNKKKTTVVANQEKTKAD